MTTATKGVHVKLILSCEIDKTYYTLTYCENNGICVDGIGDLVTYECPQTYTGQRCESAFCPDDYCNNGGICQIDPILNVTGCTCITGYTGERCEIKPHVKTCNVICLTGNSK